MKDLDLISKVHRQQALRACCPNIYTVKLGGIKLSCSGIASDLSDFKAKTEAFLDKIESGSLMSGSIENESRSREALRFESARILSVLKDHENLMIDGFDSCSSSSAINRVRI